MLQDVGWKRIKFEWLRRCRDVLFSVLLEGVECSGSRNKKRCRPSRTSRPYLSPYTNCLYLLVEKVDKFLTRRGVARCEILHGGRYGSRAGFLALVALKFEISIANISKTVSRGVTCQMGRNSGSMRAFQKMYTTRR